MKTFIFGKKAVSPVIGTILMVAVTVIMSAIVGGFVYQTARPKVPPSMSSTLADDPLVSANSIVSGVRMAKLTFEGGKNAAIAEFSALVTYWDNSDPSVETTLVLDGAAWVANTPVDMGTSQLQLAWVDSDGSGDITPGDRLDFFETDGSTNPGQGVSPATDFNVKILHKASAAFISDHTIRVY